MTNTSNNRILLVDDEPRNLKILRIRLENDYELAEASSGEKALETVQKFKPALILLDIMMDGIDGYEVTSKIREIGSLKYTKIILVSGKAMIDEKLLGYSAGADDYITKPFNGEELKAKVNVFMKLFNLEVRLNTINTSLEMEVIRRSEELLKSERLASVGMHSSEIVHNLKSPLTVIKGILIMLTKEIGENKRIKSMEGAIEKILGIIRGVLTAAPRDIKEEMEDVVISEIIVQELEFIKINSETKYNIHFEQDFRSSKPIKVSRTQIAQVFGNLIKNAVEAMGKSKEKILKIATEDFDQFTLVSIKDSGEGISEENLEKIFTSQFSTKDGKDGRPAGNGIGLPYCRRIVESLGGKISVISKVGEGSTFTIEFPHDHKINGKPLN